MFVLMFVVEMVVNIIVDMVNVNCCLCVVLVEVDDWDMVEGVILFI